jgi:hypothetical protein
MKNQPVWPETNQVTVVNYSSIRVELSGFFTCYQLSHKNKHKFNVLCYGTRNALTAFGALSAL